jgi:hypothetical protein
MASKKIVLSAQPHGLIFTWLDIHDVYDIRVA